MTRVLVTGATGFVGRQLCDLLSQRGYRLRAALRLDQTMPAHIPEKVVVGEIGAGTDWTNAIDGVQHVVHCAALAHVLSDQAGRSQQYMESNGYGTEGLAKACAAARVQRFVFLSSVKVNGERNFDTPFAPGDPPNPADAYGASKLYAEMRLTELAAISSMELAIVRSPLVYGPYVRANFLRLMNMIDRRVPLPLGSVRNSRSLVSVWNLCDLVDRLLRGAIPKSAIFMVSDGEDLSTVELIRRIGSAMGRPARLIPIPVPILRAISVLSGRKAEFERLCGSLTVDLSLTRSELEWAPPVSVDDGLIRTAKWYFDRRQES